MQSLFIRTVGLQLFQHGMVFLSFQLALLLRYTAFSNTDLSVTGATPCYYAFYSVLDRMNKEPQAKNAAYFITTAGLCFSNHPPPMMRLFISTA
jgi:hypothetical protein